MVDTTGWVPVSIDKGVSYVLYLFRPDSVEGKAYWDQGYLVQGLKQGVWIGNGDTATREVGDERSVPLSRFSEATSDR